MKLLISYLIIQTSIISHYYFTQGSQFKPLNIVEEYDPTDEKNHKLSYIANAYGKQKVSYVSEDEDEINDENRRLKNKWEDVSLDNKSVLEKLQNYKKTADEKITDFKKEYFKNLLEEKEQQQKADEKLKGYIQKEMHKISHGYYNEMEEPASPAVESELLVDIINEPTLKKTQLHQHNENIRKQEEEEEAQQVQHLSELSNQGQNYQEDLQKYQLEDSGIGDREDIMKFNEKESNSNQEDFETNQTPGETAYGTIEHMPDKTKENEVENTNGIPQREEIYGLTGANVGKEKVPVDQLLMSDVQSHRESSKPMITVDSSELNIDGINKVHAEQTDDKELASRYHDGNTDNEDMNIDENKAKTQVPNSLLYENKEQNEYDEEEEDQDGDQQISTRQAKKGNKNSTKNLKMENTDDISSRNTLTKNNTAKIFAYYDDGGEEKYLIGKTTKTKTDTAVSSNMQKNETNEKVNKSNGSESKDSNAKTIDYKLIVEDDKDRSNTSNTKMFKSNHENSQNDNNNAATATTDDDNDDIIKDHPHTKSAMVQNTTDEMKPIESTQSKIKLEDTTSNKTSHAFNDNDDNDDEDEDDDEVIKDHHDTKNAMVQNTTDEIKPIESTQSKIKLEDTTSNKTSHAFNDNDDEDDDDDDDEGVEQEYYRNKKHKEYLNTTEKLDNSSSLNETTFTGSNNSQTNNNTAADANQNAGESESANLRTIMQHQKEEEEKEEEEKLEQEFKQKMIDKKEEEEERAENEKQDHLTEMIRLYDSSDESSDNTVKKTDIHTNKKLNDRQNKKKVKNIIKQLRKIIVAARKQKLYGTKELIESKGSQENPQSDNVEVADETSSLRSDMKTNPHQENSQQYKDVNNFIKNPGGSTTKADKLQEEIETVNIKKSFHNWQRKQHHKQWPQKN